jgi:glycosyltransferase involved in cell wall biosynthesis
VRVLIFHGYLLRGTGSNVYNASLVTALAKLGHEVHLLCQDRHAGELPFVDAVGRWDGGELTVEIIREPVRVTAYLPDIGRVLPVYVADEYEGFDAKPYPDLSDDQIEHYIAANAAAVREVAERAEIDVALANHMVMGPVILARGVGDVPYAVKIHGSALTYTVAPHPQRFLPYAFEGLAPARAVLVGSRHTAEGLWEVMDDPAVEQKTRLGPPGVDADAFVPRSDAAARLRGLADRLEGAGAAGWGGEAGAADALRALDPEHDRIVSFVGKLIVSKGVDLLVAAWPLVTRAVPDARLVVVGFGTYRDGIERLANALRDGDLEQAREIARRGRELEGGPPGELRFLTAFLDRVASDVDRRAAYLDAAAHGLARIHFTGRLEHSDLPDLLPAVQAQVVPSTWPEAFGMVAAEAASCGVLPVSAAHSGLAEVSKILAESLPEDLRPLLSFELADDAVEQIVDRLVRWMQLDPGDRAAACRALSDTARERFSWEGVAGGVIAAAEGHLDALPLP